MHETTMTPYQRSELIRTLKNTWPMEKLACLNDRQLHQQWLANCEYKPYDKGRWGPLGKFKEAGDE